VVFIFIKDSLRPLHCRGGRRKKGRRTHAFGKQPRSGKPLVLALLLERCELRVVKLVVVRFSAGCKRRKEEVNAVPR
jgi:hypothetical protein